MKEDFLHYVWKFQKFPHKNLNSTQGEAIHILHIGLYNQHDGPDFLEAQLILGDLKWIGSVELHLKSSDWYRHQHQRDKAYDNVILHVVWEDNVDVCLESGKALPTLELKDLVETGLVRDYTRKLNTPAIFIPCEKHFKGFPKSLFELWKERLFVERLEEKSARIQMLLNEEKNDWEAVLFLLLARNFGLNVNGKSFFTMAKMIPFKVIRKLQQNAPALEALLLGQAGLLSAPQEHIYAQTLREEHKYLQHKFSLPPISEVSLRFKRLRPQNFPTIRLVQLAQLYANSTGVFSRIFNRDTISTDWMKSVGVSSFWKTHYTFERTSKAADKKLSNSFVDLLKINTLIPLYFCFQKAKGVDPSANIIGFMREIKAEKNALVSGFQALGAVAKNALDSQAFLQLKKEYCTQKKCLLCNVGVHLLNHPT